MLVNADLTRELQSWLANPEAYAKQEELRLQKAQKAGLKKVSKSLRKYIQGQRVYADWLQYEYDECVPVWRLIEKTEPKALYVQLRQCGYVWDTKRSIWRLHARLSAPRHSR